MPYATQSGLCWTTSRTRNIRLGRIVASRWPRSRVRNTQVDDPPFHSSTWSSPSSSRVHEVPVRSQSCTYQTGWTSSSSKNSALLHRFSVTGP